MNNILVLLTMKHSYKAALDLVSLGYKVSIITLDPKHTQVKKISGYIDLRYQTKSTFENIFFESDFRLKSVSNKLKNYLDEIKPKVAFCLSWHWLIDTKFLNKFRDGVFGWHGSMFRLPNGLGRSPMNIPLFSMGLADVPKRILTRSPDRILISIHTTLQLDLDD